MGYRSGSIGHLVCCVVAAMLVGMAGCATTSPPASDRVGGNENRAAATSPPPPVSQEPSRPLTARPPKVDANTNLPAAPPASIPPSSGSIATKPSSMPADSRPPSPPAMLGSAPIVPVANENDAPGDENEVTPTSGGTVEINFENADLNEVIRTIADLLNMQYIVDPGVQGSVTIHTAGNLAREDLLPIFFKILEVNNLTAIKDGALYRITPTREASRLPILAGRGGTGASGAVPPGERVMIQIIPLKHIAADEMSKLLAPFASDGATIVAHQGTNTLVVVDKGDNILKILKIAAAFDIGLFERIEHRFYLLNNAAAKETAGTLQEVFALDDNKGTVRIIPIERLNAVLVLSADPHVFAKTDQLMIQLDAPGEGIEPRIYVYFVKNGGAEELSGLLNAVIAKSPQMLESFRKEEKAQFRFSRNPFAVRPEPAVVIEDNAAPPVENSQPDSLTAASRSAISIVPDLVRNALIIEGTPQDYRVVSDILNQIDVLPRQVLIEATIAEISLGDRFELGVEWEYTRERTDNATGLLRGTINGDGLSYAIAFSQDLLHNLNTLAAKNKVNILSSPHVLASDGQEARIDVSNEVPIISSETVISSSAEPLVTTQIQYRDTGVLLSVTPHINSNGLVTMDVYQEVSEQGEDVNVAGENYPSFFKRSVDTRLTVRNDQTIVLGGLIRENKGQNRSGVPGLIDIPGLGWLFGDRDESYDKAELIILLTPRVISSITEVEAVTEEFERKVGETMRYIQEKQESNYINP